jgi:hypothetical protein
MNEKSFLYARTKSLTNSLAFSSTLRGGRLSVSCVREREGDRVYRRSVLFFHKLDYNWLSAVF